VPAELLLQSIGLPVPAGQYDPAGHCKKVEELPEGQYEPDEQITGADVPATQYEPAGQANVPDVEPAAQKNPAGHKYAADSPVALLKYPANADIDVDPLGQKFPAAQTIRTVVFGQ
jgi:hypothetical protein